MSRVRVGTWVAGVGAESGKRWWFAAHLSLLAALLSSCAPHGDWEEVGDEDTSLAADASGPTDAGSDAGDEAGSPAPTDDGYGGSAALGGGSTSSTRRPHTRTNGDTRPSGATGAPGRVVPLSALGAPNDGAIATATVGGSAPSSYSVALAFGGATLTTPTLRAVGGVKVSYTRNGPTPNVGCAGGLGETVATIPVAAISGYNLTTGSGTVTLSSLAAGSYLFRVCAYDPANPALIADGAVSSTVLATTVPSSGAIGSAVVSGGTNLTVSFSGMTDPDNVAIHGVQVSYLTNGGIPSSNCTTAAGETVQLVQVASIAGYNSSTGSGSVTLNGLGSATYKVRICAVDATDTSRYAAGARVNATLPVAKPANGTLDSATQGGSGPSSYSVTLALSGFTADDSGISGVKVSYTTDGSTPAVGCAATGTATVATVGKASISGYSSSTGNGTLTRSGLGYGNYIFRVCGVDANDGTVIADGALISTSLTTAPGSGSINSAVVSGSNLTLTFSGMSDPDGSSIHGVKVSYLTNGNTPSANCLASAGETVSTVPVASITGPSASAGTGSIVMTGLGAATYKIRICAVDGTNASLTASGATNVVSLPAVTPADGLLSASVGGSGPSSYSVTLNLFGFTADDLGIGSVKVSYTSDGSTPAVGCAATGTATVYSVSRSSITNYNATAGTGTITRFGLAAKNYQFRVCAVDANDSALIATGSTVSTSATTLPSSGWISSAVVGGSNLTLAFSGMTDSDNIAINGVKVSYLTNGSTPSGSCSAVGGATVVTIPAGSISNYNSGSGSGSVTLTGLSAATYRVRVCPIDGTNPTLTSGGTTTVVSLPVVKPSSGAILSTTIAGSAPYSYSATLAFTGFTADDNGISSVILSYTTDGTTPGVGCTALGSEHVSQTWTGSISGYNSAVGSGSIVRSGLAAGNYRFRICGVDANDGSVIGDGALTTATVTTAPATGTVDSATVSGSSLTLSFSGMTDADLVALHAVKVSYLTDGNTPSTHCSASAGETVVTIPAAFIASYDPSAGSGRVTLSGLPDATYQVRLCAVDGTSTLLAASGTTRIVSLPAIKPATGSILRATVTASAPSYSVSLALSGFTADDMGISRVKVAYSTQGTPPVGCASGAGVVVTTLNTSSLTGYDPVAGTGTLVRSGLGAGAYKFRVCGVDANDTSLVGDGALEPVTMPVVRPSDGKVLRYEVLPRASGSYTVKLDLSGFTADDSGIGGVRVRVNTGSTLPAAGCGAPGTYASGASDVGTTGAGVYPSSFNPATGVGSVSVPGLTIPSGTVAMYSLRVCSVEANDHSVLASGSTITVYVRTDQSAPATGSVDGGEITVSGSGEATIPLAGFKDDRAVAAVLVIVNKGTTMPASQCKTPGNAGLDRVLSGASLPALDGNGDGSITVSGLVPSNPGTAYIMRICSRDAEGNTSTGVTVRVTAKTGGATPPTGRSFDALVSAAFEETYGVLNVRAADFPTAKLTVQCPNPLATAAASDSEVGAFEANAPPFTAGSICHAEPTVQCAGPRCTATTVGVPDPCPRSIKKLALAIRCAVAAPRSATAMALTARVSDSLTAAKANLALTCPHPADVITSLDADYGDPVLDDTDLTKDPGCTATVDAAYSATLAALRAKCVGAHACTIPQGLATPSLTPGSLATAACPSRAATAATFTCGGSYASSPAVLLQVTGTGGVEICISNSPLTSEGTSATRRGTCSGGTWLALGPIEAALTAGTYPWTLSFGDGLKTVYIKYRDAAFNESAVMARQIQVDTIAPQRQGLTALADGPGVTTPQGKPLRNVIYWGNFLETGAGIASYHMVYAKGGALPPTDCSGSYPDVVRISDWYESSSDSDAKPSSKAAPFVHSVEYDAMGAATSTPLQAGATYTYRVCATDRVGRTSTLATSTANAALTSGTATDIVASTYAPGALARAVAAANYTRPTLTGSYSLRDRNGSIAAGMSDSIYVDVVTGSLSFASSSGNALEAYCFSASADPAACTSSMWHSASEIVDLDGSGPGTATGIPAGATLSSANGVKKLYAHARDVYMNVTRAPSTLSATIQLKR